ncbi:glycosyltransferase [Maribacter halichondriae]|uniref:glycosyltransferase n=1 Tax=Maribacter halichondriae TaxID=2980554 RepID=UPI0023597965|nr:glycosyltransferase [Maribacter sp. Hal144]
MILHLERKFTSPTETFIVNQINAIDAFDHSVFTIQYLGSLEANAKIYAPLKMLSFGTKVLRKSHKKYFENEFHKIVPQLIHGHYLTDAAVFLPFTKNKNIPKICSAYGYDVSVIPQKIGPFAKSYYKRIFDEYDLILPMTEEMKKDLVELGCPENKLHIHYHGIDTKKFEMERDYELSNGVLNLLTIASLLPVKGHMSVLKALKKLVTDEPNIKIKYHLVGEGSHKQELTHFIESNGLSNLVHFYGPLKHGPEFNEKLKNADIFVHPSITTKQNDKEGIPGAVVEAMASGLPVISTWHGGIPSVISDGTTGFLVKEHDSHDIADKITMLQKDMGLRKRIGENAKKHARKNLDLLRKQTNWR